MMPARVLIASVVLYLLVTIAIGLWACVVPLAAGIFWNRANVPGAMLSVMFGLASWSIAEAVAAEATVPPQLVGLGFSLIGMVLGSLVPRPAAKAATHYHGGH